jgi:ATPase subunit of ABC transporter with duplicated ATPase domains
LRCVCSLPVGRCTLLYGTVYVSDCDLFNLPMTLLYSTVYESLQSPAEQSRAEQSRAEQSRAEQSRAEQSRAEQSRAERSGAERSRAEQSRAEQSRAEQSRAEQSRAEQSRAEQSRAHVFFLQPYLQGTSAPLPPPPKLLCQYDHILYKNYRRFLLPVYSMTIARTHNTALH